MCLPEEFQNPLGLRNSFDKLASLSRAAADVELDLHWDNPLSMCLRDVIVVLAGRISEFKDSETRSRELARLAGRTAANVDLDLHDVPPFRERGTASFVSWRQKA